MTQSTINHIILTLFKMRVKITLFLVILMICGLAVCDKDYQERNNRMVPDFKPFNHPAKKMEPAGRQTGAGGPAGKQTGAGGPAGRQTGARGPISKVEWVAGVVPLFGKLFSGPVKLEQPEQTNSPHLLGSVGVVIFLAVIMFRRKGNEEEEKVVDKKDSNKKVGYTTDEVEIKNEERSRLVFCRRQTLIDDCNQFEKIEELKVATDILIKTDDDPDELLEVTVKRDESDKPSDVLIKADDDDKLLKVMLKHKELNNTSNIMIKEEGDCDKSLEVTLNETDGTPSIISQDRLEKEDFSTKFEELKEETDILIKKDGDPDEISEVMVKHDESDKPIDVLIKADDDDNLSKVMLKHKELNKTSNIMIEAEGDLDKSLEVTLNETDGRPSIIFQDRYEKEEFSTKCEGILKPDIIITNTDENSISDELNEPMENSKHCFAMVKEQTNTYQTPLEVVKLKGNTEENNICDELNEPMENSKHCSATVKEETNTYQTPLEDVKLKGNTKENNKSDEFNLDSSKHCFATIEEKTNTYQTPLEDVKLKGNVKENIDLDIVLFLKKENASDSPSGMGEECEVIIDQSENLYEVKIHNVDVSLVIDEKIINIDGSNALETNHEYSQNSESESNIFSKEEESYQSKEKCMEPISTDAILLSIQNGFSSADLTKTCSSSQDHQISKRVKQKKKKLTNIVDINKIGDECLNGQLDTVYNISSLETRNSEENTLEEPDYITKIKSFKITKSPKLHQANIVQYGPGNGVVEGLQVTLLQKEEDLKISLKSASAEVNTEGANTSRLKITVVLKKSEDECLSTTMTLKEYMVSMSNEIIEKAVRRVRTDCSLENIKHLEATIKRYRPESADMKTKSL